ncbi:MAG: dihydroxyacetone kinase subunit DhaL [Spirochaetia bacterium]|jgi:dihydroxyacetone kinase-like protein
MNSLGVQDIRAIVSGIAVLMTEKKEELIRLDGAMGDGDLGLTMEKGFSAAREEAGKVDEPDLGKYLMKIGMAIARAAPSTMGTLVATGFMSGGKAVADASGLGGREMAAFFEAFTAGIMQRGKSKPGEKTIVDVLLPASQALAAAVSSGADLPEAFRRLRAAAAEGREQAKEMIAQHGRLAYYQEQSKGRDDPGAVACMYILQGFCDHISGPA